MTNTAICWNTLRADGTSRKAVTLRRIGRSAGKAEGSLTLGTLNDYTPCPYPRLDFCGTVREELLRGGNLMWSRKHDRCQECGTDERKHYGKGLCYRCYNRQKYRENPEPQKARSRRYYKDHGEAKRAYQRKYHEDNREDRLAYCKMYREEVFFGGMRAKILERDGHRCTTSGCGATDQLVVHHRDRRGWGHENPDNSPENLRTVCRPCHVRIHVPRLGTGGVKI